MMRPLGAARHDGQAHEVALLEREHLAADDARVARPVDGPRMMTMFSSLGPTMAARKMAKVSAGRASHVSVRRMIAWSTQPPR